jgi:ABC-type transport system involved in multi-copper enzyme maturation permease subunit
MRELRFRLGSVWFWVIASGICLMAWLYGAGFLASFETESVMVTTDPLLALNIMVVIFLGLVLGLRLAASMAWEREHHTLEVLMVAPVGWLAIVAAKFLVEVVVLLALVAIYAAYLIVAQPLGTGVIDVRNIAGLALMPIFAAPVMAFGLLVGTGLGTVRTSVVVFLFALGLFAAVEIAHGVLAAQPVDQMSLPGLYARHALDLAAPVLRALSPAASLARLVETLTLQLPLALPQAASALALTLILLALSVAAGRVRGALR